MSQAGVQERLKVDGAETTVLLEAPAEESAGRLIVLAHGAGGHMAHATAQWQAQMLLGLGAHVLRFNFPYRAAGRSAPDRMPRLQACYQAATAWARERLPGSSVIIGGHSMGGRVASMLAADGFACDGLLLFAYPLHPPGKPDRLRDRHLSDIHCPALCFNGTRDAFCTPALMDDIVGGLGHGWRQHWVQGGDHGFAVLKRSGRTREDVTTEIALATRDWLAAAV